MAEPNVGEAIGLSTRATGNIGSPITRGLQLGEQNLLREAQLDFKRQAAEQKRREELNKMIVVNPKSSTHPLVVKRMTNIAKEATYAVNDPNKSPMEKQQLGIDAAGAMMDEQALDKDLSDSSKYVTNKNNLVYPGLVDVIKSETDDDFKKNSQKLDSEDRRLMSGAFGFRKVAGLETPVVQTPYPDVPITQYANNMWKTALQNEQTDVQRRTGNFTTVVQDLTPEQMIKVIHDNVIDNPALGYNLLFKNKEEAKSLLREQDRINPSASDDEKILNVELILGEKVLGKYYKDKYGLKYDRDLNKDAGNGYQPGGNTFNPTLTPAKDAVEAYVAAGVLSKEQYNLYQQALKENPDVAAKALNGLPDLPSLAPPNTGEYTLTLPDNTTAKVDNLNLVWVRGTDGHKGMPVLMGTKKEFGVETPVAIPVNEYTYGQILSVYKKASKADLEKMISKRLKDYGINEDFVINVTPKTGTTRSGTGNSKFKGAKPAPVNVSGFFKTK